MRQEPLQKAIRGWPQKPLRSICAGHERLKLTPHIKTGALNDPHLAVLQDETSTVSVGTQHVPPQGNV